MKMRTLQPYTLPLFTLIREKVDTPEKLITSMEVPGKANKSKPNKMMITTIIVLAVLLMIVTISLGTALGLTYSKVSNSMKLQTKKYFTHSKVNDSMKTQKESTSTAKQYINMTYWSQTDIRKFLQITELPALEELTVCFCYEPSQNNPISIVSKEYHTETLTSITSDENDNAFLLGFYMTDDTPMLKLANEPHENAFTDNLLSFKEKHRHFFVWKRLHYFKVDL